MSAFLAIIGLIIAVWRPQVLDCFPAHDPRSTVGAEIEWSFVGAFTASDGNRANPSFPLTSRSKCVETTWVSYHTHAAVGPA